MRCHHCGRKIALYMQGTDDIDGKPHCGACREYGRTIADLNGKLKLTVLLNEALVQDVEERDAQVAALHMSLKRIGNEIAKQDHYYLGMIHQQEMSQHAKAQEAQDA